MSDTLLTLMHLVMLITCSTHKKSKTCVPIGNACHRSVTCSCKRSSSSNAIPRECQIFFTLIQQKKKNC